MVTRVYTASSSCSTTIKKQQQEVMQYLESHNIDIDVVDITMSEDQRQCMYRNIPKDKWPERGNPLPPQIFHDDTYCGCTFPGHPGFIVRLARNPDALSACKEACIDGAHLRIDYNDFFEAKESNTVCSFLRIKPKPTTKNEEI